jgi:hypothetical protein
MSAASELARASKWVAYTPERLLTSKNLFSEISLSFVDIISSGLESLFVPSNAIYVALAVPQESYCSVS